MMAALRHDEADLLSNFQEIVAADPDLARFLPSVLDQSRSLHNHIANRTGWLQCWGSPRIFLYVQLWSHSGSGFDKAAMPSGIELAPR